MRCKCCNIEMVWRDFKMAQEDGTEEDLCSICLNVSENPDYYDPHCYVFSEVTEALLPFVVTPVKKIEY